MHSLKRRPILLLEVLIAFAIIVLCIFPLIYPHAMMAKSQREFIHKIELDHAVTLLFAQIYQDLLTNKIEWADIEGKKQFEISQQDLQKFSQGKKLPFTGSYSFKPVIHKPKSQTPQETTAYIFTLTFNFQPQYITPKMRFKSRSKAGLKYKYKLFILRDLRTVKENENQKNENPGNEKQEAA
jgi:hypothetical protein